MTRPGATEIDDAREGQASGPALPRARGPVTEALLARLRTAPTSEVVLPVAEDDPVWGDDSALALYCCYELHYRSFAGVTSEWEWDPSLLAARQRLEAAFERRLRDETGACDGTDSVRDELRRLAHEQHGPSLSGHMATVGSRDELRELAIHRSAYQLKEADPHTWAIPRLGGASKAALVAIQHDEYGGGIAGRMHSDLFAGTLRALGLDDTYGAHLDRLPGTTLATVNLMSWLGLHRRMRGAIVGHLALFEMTAVVPMRRYAQAAVRLGFPDACEFFEVHVDADADHELVALERMCGSVVADEPELAGDVVFGARALDVVERRFSRHLLDRWAAGRTSLGAP